MKNKVIIKGNKYGVSIVLDPDTEFAELLDELKIRLSKAETFFDSNKQIAASFEGRHLNNDELDQILSIIENDSKLNIQYILDENGEAESIFHDVISGDPDKKNIDYKNEHIDYADYSGYSELNAQDGDNIIYSDDSYSKDNVLMSSASSTGMFYKGTLRSGQKLEAENSIVIIGDVNPGASVIAGGNIVIIGSLTGSVQAGSGGNRNCFVMALSMSPIQIQIADIIARSSDKKNSDKKSFDRLFDKKSDKRLQKGEPMIATVIDNHIYVENISKSSIQDIII